MQHALFVVLSLLNMRSEAAAGDGGVYIMSGNGSTRTAVHFIIENNAGQRTGQLLSGLKVAEIPGSKYFYGTESIDNHTTGAPDEQAVSIQTTKLTPGHYKIKLLPLATTAYWLDVTMTQDNGSHLNYHTESFATAHTTITFDFDFQPAASAPMPITKTVTIASLRQSVQAALEIGQLGDAAFVSRLGKMLIKVETFTAKGQNKQAADRLDQFIHRLESAFKKEPDPNAGDDPADIKSADTVKRFILAKARDTLQADARTLITSLGETPKK